MGSILFSIAAFIVALGILITVHEFGHYWVARRMGVKVLRFSIGFGKPLLRWVKGADRTEYVIAALPLGGYVKMLDAREGGEIPESERHREFTQKTVYARFAIVFAGPLFNFIFALLAYWLLFVVGISGLKPVVGEVLPDSLAARAGVEVGERIRTLDGKPVQTWGQFNAHIIRLAVDGGKVDLGLVRNEYAVPHVATLQIPQMMDIKPAQLMKTVGIYPQFPIPAAAVGKIKPDSAAERAGLREGDLIRRIDGMEVANWDEMTAIIRASADKRLLLTLVRDGGQMELEVTPSRLTTPEGDIGILGFHHIPLSNAERAPFLALERYGMVEAIAQSAGRIVDMSALSLKMMWRMLMGQASLENLSGPITIADYAGKTASIGMSEFLSFLALISISLGIINLLPIPLLDGGHLMYYLVEMVKGSPVSEQVEMAGQRIGIALLLTLMSIAFINDIVRILN